MMLSQWQSNQHCCCLTWNKLDLLLFLFWQYLQININIWPWFQMKEKGFFNRYMKFLSFLVLISKTSVQYFTSKDSNEIKGDILGSFESSTFTELYLKEDTRHFSHRFLHYWFIYFRSKRDWTWMFHRSPWCQDSNSHYNQSARRCWLESSDRVRHGKI